MAGHSSLRIIGRVTFDGQPDSEFEPPPPVGRTLLKIGLLLLPLAVLVLASALYLLLRVVGWWESVRRALEGWEF